MRRTPVLIVGGGPAGAAAALGLARAGLPHLLIERSRTPQDALCGGFMSWRTLETLRRIGVAADELNPAPVTRTRLFAGGQTAEARLPKPARAVSRLKLDALLLDRAVAAGAAVERGVVARSIDGLQARIGDSAIVADALFLASGKYEVRGVTRPVAVADDPALGLRIRLPAGAALTRLVGDAVELHLFDRGYAGLVLQEDGSANLCLAVRRSRLAESGDPATLLRVLGNEQPALAERLGEADLRGADAVANIPYGWRARAAAPGIFRLGDQAAVIPSLAGEGMGIALASAVAAVRAYVRGESAADFQQMLHRATARPVGVASVIRSAAERGWSAHALVAAVRIAPALASAVARLTRISI